MRATSLVHVTYDGRALIPDGNYATAQVADTFGAGEVALIDIKPERSAKSHNHQFGFVKAAWDSLPEAHKDAPYAVSPEHLRKHALIATGYCFGTVIDVGKGDANMVANALRSADRQADLYRVISVDGSLITIFVAESQKMKAMGRERFQQSKQAILEYLAGMIGVEPHDLARMGREGAA